MTTLVIGAAGATGSLVVDRLISRGEPVVALVRNPAKSTPREGLEVRVGNSRSAVDVAAAMEGVDRVVTMIGLRSGSVDALVEESSRALTEAAARTGVKRVVVLSA